jgi:hypothetical protein
VSPAWSVCGNGIVEQNEICDGSECCTATCTQAPNGTACGRPATSCRLPSACFDFTCFDGALVADGTACDDGDACTAGEICRKGECVGGTVRCQATPSVPVPVIRPVAGAVVVEVECNVPGGPGGACSAATFLPEPTGTAMSAAIEASSNDLSCDFTRQITRPVTRPLDGNGVARLKLKLNKLARRLLRRLPVSAPVTLTVCTKIQFPTGESLTLVDVVNAARQ